LFRNIRVWRLKEGALTCLLVGSGHTEAVGGLAFSRQLSALLVSVSKDTTIKTWSLDFSGATMASTRTEIAHDKGAAGILSVLWMPLSFNADPYPAFYINADPDRIQEAKQMQIHTDPFSSQTFKVTKCRIFP
jgi:WD40 repeat protein